MDSMRSRNAWRASWPAGSLRHAKRAARRATRRNDRRGRTQLAARQDGKNPLTWNEAGSGGKAANLGALRFPKPPYPAQATTLAPLEKGLTGARCNNSLLEVDTGWFSPFRDTLTLLYGSYHRNDYGLFYANIRANAVDRVASWQAQHRE